MMLSCVSVFMQGIKDASRANGFRRYIGTKGTNNIMPKPTAVRSGELEELESEQKLALSD